MRKWLNRAVSVKRLGSVFRASGVNSYYVQRSEAVRLNAVGQLTDPDFGTYVFSLVECLVALYIGDMKKTRLKKRRKKTCRERSRQAAKTP